MNELDYYILDVFAKNKYEGNQLAVFVDLNDELSTEEMLNIAKEINFAESTFIKKQITSNKFRVRIFTPESEIPFAGHPSIGTSYIIAKYLMSEESNEVILALNHGDIKVKLPSRIDLDTGLFKMTQSQPEYLKIFTKEEIARQLEIERSFICDDEMIQEISTGLPFIIIPIKDLKSMEQIKLSPDKFKSFLLNNKIYKTNNDSQLSTSLFFSTTETYESGNDYNTRMFCLENEILIEDSATGSANGCFLAYLLKYKNKEITAKTEQGFQMGRRSYLYLEGKFLNGNYELVVGGNSKLMSMGKWIM